MRSKIDFKRYLLDIAGLNLRHWSGAGDLRYQFYTHGPTDPWGHIDSQTVVMTVKTWHQSYINSVDLLKFMFEIHGPPFLNYKERRHGK